MSAITPNGSTNQAQHVGTLIGESTSREFRMAVAHEAVREQDIVAVDVSFRPTSENPEPERLRVWAKIQRIERLNPLFPHEAAHELAGTGTNPFDTVVSLSREMVTAVCQVLGAEPIGGERGGRLGSLRYPPQPVSSAYRPAAADIKRVLIGDLAERQDRALDLATLSTRSDIDVAVDGHAIVSRHLAILAMTGAGKSWTARRIIEELAARDYPIVIFDPHGEYTGLAEVPALKDRVKLYQTHIPILDESPDDAQALIESLAGEEMSAPQVEGFSMLFRAARRVISDDNLRSGKLEETLFAITGNENIRKYPLRSDLFALSHLAEAVHTALTNKDAEGKRALADLGFSQINQIPQQQFGSFRVLARQLRRASFELKKNADINRLRSPQGSVPLPADRSELVRYGQISVVMMAGYPDTLKATAYSLIAGDLFHGRVQGKVKYPFNMVIEEAHNFVPSSASEIAIQRSIALTKQVAQEGRKFNVGLTLISQRPSRLDETTLAMCNSFIIMRMINPDDQRFVRRVIESLGEDEAQLLPDLDVGEAILSGQMVNFPVLVKMKAPASRGEREETDAFEVLRKAHAEAARARRS
ncbi:MAG TPA: ATP-binding protein [Thermomicrobiales bacterium]|nr:ATP-binding protein [Thermomicrobiales bacterium]